MKGDFNFLFTIGIFNVYKANGELYDPSYFIEYKDNWQFWNKLHDDVYQGGYDKHLGETFSKNGQIKRYGDGGAFYFNNLDDIKKLSDELEPYLIMAKLIG